MKTLVGEAIGLGTQPVALLWSDEAPEGAIRFKAGRWGCGATLFAAAAARGRVGALDNQTYGCWGCGVGMGFGNAYQTFPGGIECFNRFLSQGNETCEQGRALGERLQASGGGAFADDFLHGERYQRDAAVTARFVESLPMREIPARYVVLKPLSLVDPGQETPKSVTFFVDADQLSALVVLANFGDPLGESVVIPWAAACQVMGILAYRELDRERPRGLVGLTDLTARRNVRGSLGAGVMSFTAPWPLFQQMEKDAGSSFLERETWKALRGKGPGAEAVL